MHIETKRFRKYVREWSCHVCLRDSVMTCISAFKDDMCTLTFRPRRKFICNSLMQDDPGCQNATPNVKLACFVGCPLSWRFYLNTLHNSDYAIFHAPWKLHLEPHFELSVIQVLHGMHATRQPANPINSGRSDLSFESQGCECDIFILPKKTSTYWSIDISKPSLEWIVKLRHDMRPTSLMRIIAFLAWTFPGSRTRACSKSAQQLNAMSLRYPFPRNRIKQAR